MPLQFASSHPNLDRRSPTCRPTSWTIAPSSMFWRRTAASVSMAVLGKVRRRWLERQPRDPSSPHPNRLADVLARMVADGVLVKQGARYVPGPDYARYVGTPEPAAVA